MIEKGAKNGDSSEQYKEQVRLVLDYSIWYLCVKWIQKNV